MDSTKVFISPYFYYNNSKVWGEGEGGCKWRGIGHHRPPHGYAPEFNTYGSDLHSIHLSVRLALAAAWMTPPTPTHDLPEWQSKTGLKGRMFIVNVSAFKEKKKWQP